MGKWGPLIVLSLAQFLMVIDQAVMNVSISQLVDDFDTTVTTIQGVITLYALTMAMLMITGGKVGDILGRRRAFAVGHLIYASGSALTAASWSVGSLLVGWSILEGVGAALVLPALVALVASNYTGPFGFSLTPFMIVGGFIVLWLFKRWQEYRERSGSDPLVKLALLAVPPVRSGLASFLAQSVILLGIFFTLPLYFQIVLGFDALDTGLRMLPISIAMLVTSSSGPALATRFAPKRIVQAGFVTLVLAAFLLLGRIDPELNDLGVSISLVVLGVGMGLIASQLGNVIQSSVEAADRGEAGGLQYTAQQLGSALGTAVIGAVVIGSLVSAFIGNIETNDEVPGEVTEAIAIAVNDNASFVPAAQVADGLLDAGVDATTTDRIVDDYESAQLEALKFGLLIAALIALGALFTTSNLPSERLGRTDETEPRPVSG
jgi:predicted MFS family arabinose efflux permease